MYYLIIINIIYYLNLINILSFFILYKQLPNLVNIIRLTVTNIFRGM